MSVFTDWKRNVPSHWQHAKLKYVASLKSGDFITSESISEEGPYPVYGGNGFRGYTDSFNYSGDYVLVGRQGALCGNINYASGDFWASEHAIVIAPRNQNCVKWLGELLRYLDLNKLSQSAAQPGIAVADVSNIDIVIPPLAEQLAIAEYIDQEAVRIEELIFVKERLIELLTEKRLALITRAVTRGLESNVTYRDSGINWLGEIPAHWQIERARWLFRERDQRSETGEEELLTVSHLTGVTPRSEKEVTMFEAETKEGYKICKKGDLVINTMWAWMGAMGVSPLDGIVSPGYNVYEPNKHIDPGYVDALVRLPIFAQEVTRYSKGVWSSRLRLYPEGFFAVYLPVPPIEEQYKIVKNITSETNKITSLSSATKRAITILKERRDSLTAAAVTGQIGVGGRP